jgi:hypothetical protein
MLERGLADGFGVLAVQAAGDKTLTNGFRAVNLPE